MIEKDDPAARKTVSLPSSVWRRIEDFQFANRIKRETEAIRRLIELGLNATAEPGAEPKARKPAAKG